MKTYTVYRRPKGFAMMEFFVLVFVSVMIATAVVGGFRSYYKGRLKTSVESEQQSQKK